MHKVIYAVSRMHDWIKIAQNLQKELDWEPCYWISPPELREELLKVFPNVIYHNCFDLYKGIFPEVYDNLPLQLDENDIKEYLYYEHIVLKMMDRLDMNDSFTYNERIEHYFKLLNYWLHVVDILQPKISFFAQAPHFVADYILYAVCKRKGINTIITQPISSIRGMMILNTEIEETNKELRNRYQELLRVDDIKLNEEFSNYLKNIRSKEYGKAQPTYMELGLKEKTIFLYFKKILNFKKWFNYLKLLLIKLITLRKQHKNYLKVKGKPFSESTLTNFQYSIYKKKGNIYKKKLKKYYLSLCEKPDFSKKYIYVALHYQPERSTSPEGGVYVEQELMVNLLSSLIPKDYYLYVKEHPLQFSSNLKGEHGRKKSFYDNLAKLKNVKFIPLNVSVFNLIDHSVAVATVKGTASFEAVLRGKPSLVFGNAWYRDCNGVFYVPNKQDLKKALNQIINGVVIEDKYTLAFLKALEEIGFKGCVANKEKKLLNLNDIENVKNFSEKIINYFKNNND